MAIRITTIDKHSTATDNSHCTLITFSSTTKKLSDQVIFIAAPIVTDN
jgi:hypothetical protein